MADNLKGETIIKNTKVTRNEETEREQKSLEIMIEPNHLINFLIS